MKYWFSDLVILIFAAMLIYVIFVDTTHTKKQLDPEILYYLHN